MKHNENEELAHLLKLFEESEMNTQDSRALSVRDRDYYDNKQWTAEEVAVLRSRKQPCVTINHIKPRIDTLLGMEQEYRNDPIALPRTPMHEQDAATVTDILRYIESNSQFDDVRSQAFKNFVIEGVAAAKVDVRSITDENGQAKDFDIKIKPLEWDRIFWDPHSRASNFRDCMYRGEVVFVDLDRAKAMFPGKEQILDAATMGRKNDTMQVMQDQPNVLWTDKDRNRVKIVEMWYKKGLDCYWAIFTCSGFLVEPARTPFRNDEGLDEDPYCFRSAYVARDGARYGHVRQMIDVQDEINKRRSKALHIMSVRQSRISRSSDLDTQNLRNELARPDGIVRADEGEYEVLPTGDMAQAQFSLLADAQAQLSAIGVNSALSGKTPGQVSGKALKARAFSGSIELGPLFDGIRMWQREVFKKAWNRVREYWREEKYLAVTDDPDSVRFILLNRPTNMYSYQLEAPVPSNVQVPSLPLYQMDVDIIIREGKDDSLAQQDQFAQLAEMASAGMPIPPEALIELSALHPRVKEKIIKMMKPDPETAMRQQAIQEANLQLEMGMKQAEIENEKANAMKKLADAERLKVTGQSVRISNMKEIFQSTDKEDDKK